MKIIVDADACPVRGIVTKTAKEYGLKVVMVADTSHVIDDGYSEIIVVGQGKDAVDIALMNRTEKGDIVVTQDYGVAAMALGKGAYAINQNGFIYTVDNVDKLLFERFLAQKVRRAGGKTGGHKKRKKEDNEKFEACLRRLCMQAIAAKDEEKG